MIDGYSNQGGCHNCEYVHMHCDWEIPDEFYCMRNLPHLLTKPAQPVGCDHAAWDAYRQVDDKWCDTARELLLGMTRGVMQFGICPNHKKGEEACRE